MTYFLCFLVHWLIAISAQLLPLLPVLEKTFVFEMAICLQLSSSFNWYNPVRWEKYNREYFLHCHWLSACPVPCSCFCLKAFYINTFLMYPGISLRADFPYGAVQRGFLPSLAVITCQSGHFQKWKERDLTLQCLHGQPRHESLT